VRFRRRPFDGRLGLARGGGTVRRDSRFWGRRAARQRWLRSAVGVVVLLTVAGMSIAVGAAARQPDVAVRAGFAAASATNGSMVWEGSAATDADAQDAATRARLQRAFGTVPISITPSAVGSVETGAHSLLSLRGDAALRAATSGLPALSRGEIAIEDVGARALHVAVGDTLPVQTPAGERALRITALWHVKDARAPLWNGIGPGTTGSIARVAMAGAELADDDVTLTARWSIAPDAERLRAADLAALNVGFAKLRARALAEPGLAELDGGGDDTVAAMRSGIAAVAAVVPVACALLGASALLALLLLTRLLAEVRVDETALLRARGASRAQIAAGDLRAALLPVLTAGVVGASAGQLILLLVAPPSGWWEVALPLALPVGVALVLVVGVGFAATAGRSPARGLRVAGIGAAGLLAVVAVIGVVRLLTAGVGADPSADLAPGLVVAALVVAGLVAGPAVATGAVAVARRRDGLAAALATRRVRHRPGLVAGAFVLVALAVASAGFAAGTIASAQGFLVAGGRLVTGGDLDVQTGGPASLDRDEAPPSTVTALARDAGAEAAVPAVDDPVSLGDVSTTFAAAPTGRLHLLQDSRLADIAALSPTVAAPIGLPLDGPGSLRLDLDAHADAAPADARILLTAWIVRDDSGTERIDLPPAAIGTREVRSPVPGTGTGRLVAIEAAVRSSQDVEGLTVTVRSLSRFDHGTAHPVPLPAPSWSHTKAVPAGPGTTAAGRIGWRASSVPGSGEAVALGRLMPAGPSAVPVALSRPLAASLGLAIGGRAVVTADADLDVTVVAIVPRTIGAPGDLGVWADLPTLQTAQLRTSAAVPRADRTWIAVRDPAAAAERIEASEPQAVVTASPAVLLGPLTRPVTIGMLAASIGTVLLALLGTAAVVASLLRARRADVVVLRALGAGPAAQRLASRIELVGVLGYAIVVGAIAAATTVLLAVPPIAHALAPGVATDVGAPIAVDPVPLGSALAALVAGAVVALVVQEWIVAAVAARPGGEAER
jgi:hypothetical protein